MAASDNAVPEIGGVEEVEVVEVEEGERGAKSEWRR